MIGGNGGCGGRQLRQLRNPFCLYQNMFCCTIHTCTAIMSFNITVHASGGEGAWARHTHLTLLRARW